MDSITGKKEKAGGELGSVQNNNQIEFSHLDILDDSGHSHWAPLRHIESTGQSPSPRGAHIESTGQSPSPRGALWQLCAVAILDSGPDGALWRFWTWRVILND